MTASVRRGDVAARYGGDEFGVLLRGADMDDGAGGRGADPRARRRAVGGARRRRRDDQHRRRHARRARRRRRSCWRAPTGRCTRPRRAAATGWCAPTRSRRRRPGWRRSSRSSGRPPGGGARRPNLGRNGPQSRGSRTERSGEDPEMDIDQQAPITASRSVDISASPLEVWAVLADIGRWPYLEPGRHRGPAGRRARPGSAFVWRSVRARSPRCCAPWRPGASWAGRARAWAPTGPGSGASSRRSEARA